MDSCRIFTCAERIKDKNGIIIEYVIVNDNGFSMRLSAKALKSAIMSKQLFVKNLRFTSDNRLIMINNNIKIRNATSDKKIKSITKIPTYELTSDLYWDKIMTQDVHRIRFKSSRNLSALEAKSKIMGLITERINEHILKVYSIGNDKKDVDLIVACDGIWGLGRNSYSCFGYDAWTEKKLRHHADIIDVSGVKILTDDISDIFRDITAEELIVNNVDFTKVKYAYRAFHQVSLLRLNMSNVRFSSAYEMENLFEGAKIGELNLSGMYIPKVTSLRCMFCLATIGKINLDNIYCVSVTNVEDMFGYSEISQDILKLDFLANNKIDSVRNMFIEAKIKILDISALNTRRVDTETLDMRNTRNMFKNCNISQVIIGKDFTLFDEIKGQNVIYK